MAKRLPARHELFAQAVAAGKTQLEAYTAAGFGKPHATPGSGKRYAHRLRWRPEVDRRIQEIQAAALEVSRESLTKEVNSAIVAAADNHTAIATMLTLKGRLHGLLTDNVSVKELGQPLDKLLDRLTAAGMDRKVAARMIGYVDAETAEVIPLKR